MQVSADLTRLSSSCRRQALDGVGWQGGNTWTLGSRWAWNLFLGSVSIASHQVLLTAFG